MAASASPSSSSSSLAGPLRRSICRHPLSSLALLPNAVSDLAVGGGVLAVAVLLAILPLALVLATIGPEEHAIALLLVVDVLAFVLPSVGPREGAASIHFVVEPGAHEHAAVRPVVGSLPLNVVVLKIAIVGAAVSPREAALPMLLSVHVDSVILSSIRPCLNSLPMLLVIMPVALILRTVQVTVCAIAVRLIIEPHAVVHVTVCVDQPPLAISLVGAPPAFVDRAIRPCLYSLAHTHVASNKPLAFVLGLILKNLLSLHFQLALVNAGLHTVVKLSETLPNLNHLDVVVVWHLIVVFAHLGKQTTVLRRFLELLPGYHSSNSCLEFYDQVELLVTHCIGNLLNVLQPRVHPRRLLLDVLIRSAASHAHF